MTSEIVASIGAQMARQVEYFVSMIRACGYPFPKQYELGITIASRTEYKLRFRVRLDDVHIDARWRLPRQLDASVLDRYPKFLQSTAERLVSAYTAAHPELAPDSDAAKADLARLDTDPAFFDDVNERALASARTSTYIHGRTSH